MNPIYQRFNEKNPYPGCLIVVEGIDGSGKSTQLRILTTYLRSLGYPVVSTEWNSSPLVSDVIRKAKKKKNLSPYTYSLLHATDFADRLDNIVIPALENGLVVLADRYVYTAFARDTARNCASKWVRNQYASAVQPDGIFYFKVPLKLALERILATRRPKYYEAGLDMGLSRDVEESYMLFQSKVLAEYDKMALEYGFTTYQASQSIQQKQLQFRQDVLKILKKKVKS